MPLSDRSITAIADKCASVKTTKELYQVVIAEVGEALSASRCILAPKSRKIPIEWSPSATDINLDQHVISVVDYLKDCLLYTSPSPRDNRVSRMPSSA